MIFRRSAQATTLVRSLLFAALSAYSQVRLEIRTVNTQTLRTQQILKGESGGAPVVIAGELRIPPGEGRLPAVILLHGSGGLGNAQQGWAEDLNAVGIAAFLLDSFSARGITSTANDQTQLDHLAMMVDAYRALEMLAQHPRIDPNRVAVMGWSKGAQAAVYASMQRFRRSYAPPDLEFQAHIGLFTPCNTSYRDEQKTTGKPIRLFHGIADDWVAVGPCRAYVERLKSTGVDITLTEYPAAHHSYDTVRPTGEPLQFPQASTTHNCSMAEAENGVIMNRATLKPFAYSDACVERGPHIGYNEAATRETKRAVTAFLRARFGLASRTPTPGR